MRCQMRCSLLISHCCRLNDTVDPRAVPATVQSHLTPWMEIFGAATLSFMRVFDLGGRRHPTRRPRLRLMACARSVCNGSITTKHPSPPACARIYASSAYFTTQLTIPGLFAMLPSSSCFPSG